jgi:hypothetical protein
MAGGEKALRATLRRFIDDALAMRARTSHGHGSKPLRPGVEDFAEALTELPSAQAVSRASLTAARANGYLVRDRRSAGRPMTADALVETGVAGLLLSGDPIDAPA